MIYLFFFFRINDQICHFYFTKIKILPQSDEVIVKLSHFVLILIFFVQLWNFLLYFLLSKQPSYKDRGLTTLSLAQPRATSRSYRYFSRFSSIC